MLVAQRLDIGDGKWIDVGVIGTPSEKRLDIEDRNWYTIGEFIEHYGNSQISLEIWDDSPNRARCS